MPFITISTDFLTRPNFLKFFRSYFFPMYFLVFLIFSSTLQLFDLSYHPYSWTLFVYLGFLNFRDILYLKSVSQYLFLNYGNSLHLLFLYFKFIVFSIGIIHSNGIPVDLRMLNLDEIMQISLLWSIFWLLLWYGFYQLLLLTSLYFLMLSIIYLQFSYDSLTLYF